MTVAPRRPPSRRHRPTLEPADRRRLERRGWRTLLDFHENHVRRSDGCLLRVDTVWVAAAERHDGCVALACGTTVEEAWAEVSRRVAEGRLDLPDRPSKAGRQS